MVGKRRLVIKKRLKNGDTGMVIKKLGIDIPNFSAKDVDMVPVVEAAKLESQAIFDNESTRKGRTLEEIYDVNLASQIAEKFMIQKMGFEDDDRPFMDIIFNNTTIDIKTSPTGQVRVFKGKILEELSNRRAAGLLVADYIIGIDIIGGIYMPRFFSKVPTKVNKLQFVVVDRYKHSKIDTTPETLYNWLVDKTNKSVAIKTMIQTYGVEVK